MVNTFWKRLATAESQTLTPDTQLLRTLLDTVPDMIYVKDLQNRFVLVNQATLKRHGLESDDQIIGKSDIDLFGEQGQGFIQQEQEIFRTGQPLLNAEFNTQDRYGNPMRTLISKVPLRDNTGHIIGLLGINRNITERLYAENSIREHHDRFLAAAENSLSAFFILESVRNEAGQIVDFVFTYVNSRGETMVGMSRKQMVGQKLCELLPINRTGGFFEKYVSVVENGGQLDEEFCITRPDNSLAWRQHQVVPLADGIAIISQDITERKRVEAQLAYQANLIENISDAIISTSLDYTIVSWNAGASALYGWNADEALGQNMLTLIVPDSQWTEGELAQREQMFMTHGHWKGELIHQRRDGTQFPVLSTVSVVRDAADQMVGAVAVNRDMTERKQAEQQRLDLALERERVTALRQFLGDVTHDLKNPLASIKLNLYMLEKMAGDPDKHANFADKIEAQVTRLESMLDDLQTLSRLDQMAEAFTFYPLDINALVQQIVADQEPVALARAQSLSLGLSENLPPLMADSSKLYRALANLVANALKYTGDGGHITITTQTAAQHVVITVADTGIGIAAKDLPHIFDRFFQVDKKGKRGSGLGLAIARRIIIAHGGDITVASAPGVGSTFRVHLPYLS